MTTKRRTKSSLQKVFGLIDFLYRFQAIERTVKIPGRKNPENNMEHSFQLAIVSWLLAQDNKFKLNKEKILKYALVHDLVEAYAGDTDPYQSEKSYLISQEKRERQALQKIKKQFPYLKDICSAIEEYEAKNSRESKLVYVIDKVLPVINTYNAKDDYYRANKVGWQRYLARFRSKRDSIKLKDIDLDDFIESLFIFLKKKEESIFYQE